MRTSILLSICSAITATLLAAMSIVTAAVAAPPEYNPAYNKRSPEPFNQARVIVKFKETSTILAANRLKAAPSTADAVATMSARAKALGQRIGIDLAGGRGIDERTQVVTSTQIGSEELAARLAQESDIEYAIVDRRVRRHAVPNDPLYSAGPAVKTASGGPAVGQWYLRAPSGDVQSSINAPGAWDVTRGGTNIVVAVLDTGVRPEHPDLAGRLLPGYDMITDVATANDGDARDADPSDPGDWVTQAENDDKSGPFADCGAEDSSWHGTMTASLIGAATNDGTGMAGIAWNIRLLPVRVLGKCGGFASDVAAGIRWASGLPVPGVPTNATPARVINLSLGGDGGCSPTYQDAITAVTTKQNPTVVVASAGNSSGHDVGSPANCPGAIGVAGLRHAGTKVGFSDLGTQIAISAPAGNCVNTADGLPCLYPILAAANTGTTVPVASTYTDSFNISVGTSFSSPLVVGTVALMLSVNPALTPAQVKTALQASARPFPTGAAVDGTLPACHIPDTTDQLECRCNTTTCGAGMLDATAAVASVAPAGGVIEFYNTLLDNFFITANSAEVFAVDGGSAGPGWGRTGNAFKAGGGAQVCRFYGSISPGPNSHFYTIDPAECANLKAIQAATPASQPRWNFESLDFASTPASAGNCAPGTVPVYRAYNNGFARGVDSNHRITSNQGAIQEVVNRGWNNEGVVMCAPQ